MSTPTAYNYELAKPFYPAHPWHVASKMVWPGVDPKNTARAKRRIDRELSSQSITPTVQFTGDESRKDTYTDSGWQVSAVIGKRVTTLEELTEVLDVDAARWEVYRWNATKWDVASKSDSEPDKMVGVELYRVFAEFRLRKESIAARAEVDAMLEEIRSEAPSYRVQRRNNISRGGGRRFYVVNIADLHIGKQACAEECGENYDSKIAMDCFHDAANDLLDRVRNEKLSRIVFVVGNDLLNADNLENTTTGGTPQDTDTRFYKSFRRAWKLMVWAIEQMVEIADVDVIVVPGNHDQLSSFTLGEVLSAWFSKTSNVRIDNRACLRKTYEFDSVFLTFTHGKYEKLAKLPNIIAQENPEAWGRTKFRECYIGDKHHRMDWNPAYVNNEEAGFMVRMMPSLCASDSWHSRQGYTGNLRCAIGILWDGETGIRSIHQYNVIADAASSVPSPLTN